MTGAQRKQQLRRQAASLPPPEAPHLLERFLALPQVEAADTVMLFYGVGQELDTTPLISALLSMGKRVALPVCLPHRGMEARCITGERQLSPNRYGIPEPDGACPIVPRDEIDVVLVPHLLCDRAGYRLGHGGGYYDRWLAGCRGLTVAICPRERLVDALPREPHDRPIRLVLSDP